MRYRGARPSWVPIVVTILIVVVALVALYYLFWAPKPTVVIPTLTPTQILTPVPTST